MQLIIKGLTPGLTETGKIKIGEKGRLIQSAKGNQFQPPQKLDHFRVTTLQRGPDGNYLQDLAVHQLYGDKPRKIPVRLLYDDIELNFQCRYTCFLGKTLWCYGDGESAQRIVDMSKPAERSVVQCPCGRQEPTYDKQDKCKINSCLSVIIDGVETVGGVWKLRTTSYNSTVGILSSLSLIKRLTGGPLAGLPLNLTLNPKTAIVPTSGQVSQVWVVGIEFAGKVERLQEIAYQQAQRQAVYAVKIEQIETEARRLIAASSVVDVESEASEIVEEFFPEQIEAVDITTNSSKGVVENGKAKDTAQTADAPKPDAKDAQLTRGGGGTTQDAKPVADPTKRRRRTNKFAILEPKDWNGMTELVTCGASVSQILEIRNATRTGDPAKDIVTTFLRERVGYDQLSYLTEEEATDLIVMLHELLNGPPESQNETEATAPSAPETVVCPLSSETVSVSGHCLNGCQERESSGFCPVVDDLGGEEVI